MLIFPRSSVDALPQRDKVALCGNAALRHYRILARAATPRYSRTMQRADVEEPTLVTFEEPAVDADQYEVLRWDRYEGLIVIIVREKRARELR